MYQKTLNPYFWKENFENEKFCKKKTQNFLGIILDFLRNFQYDD